MKIAVCGAGGFVGGALVKSLVEEGHEVVAVSRGPLNNWARKHPDARNLQLDFTSIASCEQAVAGCNQVYNLAAQVGGIGYIQSNKLACILASRINTNLLLACHGAGVQKYFFASSTCVYPSNDFPIREDFAHPARPEPGYGWEKLFGEQVCDAFRDGGNIETRVARYFTLYGPGDNKKHNHAPAELAKKIALAKLHGHKSIEIWGDGSQTRSLLYIDDCVEGSKRIMNSGVTNPLNLSGAESVSINSLVDAFQEIAGTKLEKVYKVNEATGVRNRVSSNLWIRNALNWEPPTPLRTGLEATFRWWWDTVLKEN